MSLVPFGKKPAAGVDNTNRRAWDKEEFRKKAEEKRQAEDEAGGEETALDAKKRKRMERDPLHQGLIVARSNLKQLDYQIDLAAKVNKTQVVGLSAAASSQAGFYCNVCDCTLKDSQSYLDHINGKYHNRALGMNMEVERSTVEQVKQRLEALKKQRQSGGGGGQDYVPDGFEAPKVGGTGRQRLKEAYAEDEEEEEEEEEEGRKQPGRDRKRDKKADSDGEDDDPDMMAMMGFGGFGTSSKK